MMQCMELAAGLANRPIALAQSHADLIAAMLRGRLPMPEGRFLSPADARERRYGLVDGVAIIPVRGVLSQDEGNWYWGTNYGWIRAGILAAVIDPEVRAILLDVNSPGGEVAGCFDLVDTIYAARGEKPIWAILNENAFSAAYAIASAADRIIVPRTGGVGSIGVIWMHADWSEAIAGSGIKVTFITYGARKADRHPEIPLSDVARGNIQADIDAMGDLFVETVARNRDLTSKKVTATEAATFLGAEGVKLGLADAVMAPDAAFMALLEQLG